MNRFLLFLLLLLAACSSHAQTMPFYGDNFVFKTRAGAELMWLYNTGKLKFPGYVNSDTTYFFTSDAAGNVILKKIYTGTPGAITQESDPVFGASAAAGISSTNIGNWNSAYSWGNHALAGYLLQSSASSIYATKDSLNNYLLKSKADSTISVNADVTANTAARHTHANKAALDVVSGTNTGDETKARIIALFGYTPADSSKYLPLAGGTLIGAIAFTPQATPSAPASGFKLFAEQTNGSLSWINSSGFVRTLRVRNQSQDLVLYLQNKSSYTAADSSDLATLATTVAGKENALTFSTGLSRNINTITVDQSFTPTWTGIHTFNNNISTTNINPISANAYSIGSATNYFKNVYASIFSAYNGSNVTSLYYDANQGYARWDYATTSIKLGSGVMSFWVNSTQVAAFGSSFAQINSSLTAYRLAVGGTAYFSGTLTTTGNINAFATKTIAYTLTSTDEIIEADASSGPITYTLPTAVNRTGQHYKIFKRDNSANAITINTTSSQSIISTSGTTTTYTLSSQGKYVEFYSNNSGWDATGN